MGILIQKQVRGYQREAEWLKRQAAAHIRKLSLRRVPGAAALKRAEISVLLTDNRRIRKLNKEWRGKDKATDVLSFPQHECQALQAFGHQARKGQGVDWCLGDVIISLEKAKEQAADRKISLKRELNFLLVHGILHLLGYDHEISPLEERRMRRLEKALLTR